MKDFAKSIRTNNTKVENSSKFDALESIIQEASMYAENAYRRLNSPYSATNIISDLSHCKQACDIGIKRAQEYDKERNKTGNSKVGNYMMNPSGQVEDLIKSSEKYIASGDKEGAKRLFGSMEIVFRQLKEDKEEHYKKYQEADDLLGKLNKAAGKLKSIL